MTRVSVVLYLNGFEFRHHINGDTVS